ncbi:MAG: sulfite exporter TauE/SafE family protein [bacterium]
MEVVITFVVVLVAAFVAGMTGFGFGIVAMSTLPLLMSVKVANPIVTFYGLSIFLILTIPLRRHLNGRSLIPLFVGSTFGIPLGVFGLVVLDEAVMKRIIGGFIFVYVIYDLFFFRGKSPRGIDPRWGYLAGFLGGCLSGAFSTGGPPVIIYCNSQNWGKYAVKVTLQAYFLGVSIYKIVLLSFSGLMTGEVWRYILYFSPAVAVGMLAGTVAFRRMHSRTFRRSVLGMLSVMALLLVLKN